MKRKKKLKVRKRWIVNPGTRIRESRKKYSRKRNKHRLKKELGQL